jgi:hypothetical protein
MFQQKSQKNIYKSIMKYMNTPTYDDYENFSMCLILNPELKIHKKSSFKINKIKLSNNEVISYFFVDYLTLLEKGISAEKIVKVVEYMKIKKSHSFVKNMIKYKSKSKVKNIFPKNSNYISKFEIIKIEKVSILRLFSKENKVKPHKISEIIKLRLLTVKYQNRVKSNALHRNYSKFLTPKSHSYYFKRAYKLPFIKSQNNDYKKIF